MNKYYPATHFLFSSYGFVFASNKVFIRADQLDIIMVGFQSKSRGYNAKD